jgi:hypothetical protein
MPQILLLKAKMQPCTCPESEARSLVNSMNESCICDNKYCMKDCAYLQTVPQSPIEHIGEICKLLDELIEIHDEREVVINQSHICCITSTVSFCPKA